MFANRPLWARLFAECEAERLAAETAPPMSPRWAVVLVCANQYGVDLTLAKHWSWLRWLRERGRLCE